MKVERIKAAMAEAKRFLERAEEMLALLPKGETDAVGRPVQSGALRRSSLDLGRSLAAMRKRP